MDAVWKEATNLFMLLITGGLLAIVMLQTEESPGFNMYLGTRR